jgi:hypothetical protein
MKCATGISAFLGHWQLDGKVFWYRQQNFVEMGVVVDILTIWKTINVACFDHIYHIK